MPRGALQCGRGCVSCAPSCRASWRRAAMPCHPACCVWLRTWPQTGDARIEELSGEIDTLARQDQACVRLMTKPGIGPIISSAMVAAIGSGDVFSKGRDFGLDQAAVPTKTLVQFPGQLVCGPGTPSIQSALCQSYLPTPWTSGTDRGFWRLIHSKCGGRCPGKILYLSPTGSTHRLSGPRVSMVRVPRSTK